MKYGWIKFKRMTFVKPVEYALFYIRFYIVYVFVLEIM